MLQRCLFLKNNPFLSRKNKGIINFVMFNNEIEEEENDISEEESLYLEWEKFCQTSV